MTIDLFEKTLLDIYSVDTCSPLCKDIWSKDNPTMGHCAIVAILFYDYFGGEIYKNEVDGIVHYFNLIDNKIIDITSSQFNKEIDYSVKRKKEKDDILRIQETLYRYNLLKERLELALTKKGVDPNEWN